MKDIVFTELLNIVRKQYDDSMVESMIEKAALPNSGTYTAIGTYYLVVGIERLVEALRAQTHLSRAQLLDAFDQHLFRRLSSLYPHFFPKDTNLIDLLASIHDHSYIKPPKLYLNSELPALTVEEWEQNRLVLFYQSSRKMGDLARGLLKGYIGHFEEPMSIMEEHLDENETKVRVILEKETQRVEEIDALRRKLAREQTARKEVQRLLEAKTLELYQAKRAEQNIRKSQAKYPDTIENMELAVMEVDKDHTISKVYNHFCQMTGYKPEELIGKNACEVFLAEHYTHIMDKQDDQRRPGKTEVHEVQMTIKGGKQVWVMISGTPFYDDDGKLAISIGIHYDISKQKALQKELEQSCWKAEKVRDAEKEFLANMSHEIRNNINSIVGMTNLMCDTPHTPEQMEYLQNIKYSSDILMALVSDVLDMSKIAEGGMELNLQEFDPVELFNAIGKTTDVRLRPKPVDFHLELAPKLPSRLLGDTTILNQILLNLLGNAIKFTNEGSIELEVGISKETERAVVLRFMVRDTGIGIEPAKLEHVFERFSQVGTPHKYGGTGLGLPITKQLIELHGGQVSVESEQGQGTTFIFHIPFERATESKIQDKLERGNGISTCPSLSILIVEDNEVNRLYLEKMIAKWGHQYQSCQNGKEALAYLEKEVFDLILMDIRTPEMDGYETTIRLRNTCSNPNANIPIIALTASALLDERDKALQAGMNVHLTKPFTSDQLANAIYPFFSAKDKAPNNKGEVLFPSPLQPEGLAKLYDGDWEHAQLMFEVFLKNTPKELQQMEAAILSENWTELGDIIHKIKPNFRMVGCSKLEGPAKALESTALNQPVNKNTLFSIWSAFKESVEQLLPKIEEAIRLIKKQQKNSKHEMSDH